MEQQPQQEMYYPAPSAGGYPNMDSKADFLDKIKPEEAVKSIKQMLMGREYDEDSETWIENPELKGMALTERGASAITNLMFSASTRNVSISNLKDDEIKKRLLSIIKTAMKMCLDNFEAYGIKEESQFFFIREVVHTNTLVAMKQSENEGIRRMLNSTISEQRSVNTYGEEKKGGMLGLFRR
jgi:hypothetical protein